jgi:hypothetical protein
MTLALRGKPIDARIVTLRGYRVMISTDLAKLYGVEPRVLAQAVKRNSERFPPDFMFRCTPDEALALRSSRSQSVILKRGGNLKYAPYAFTQEGVAMLSSVLRSPQAVRVNIEIMRAFVRVSRLVVANEDLGRRIEELAQKHDRHDRQLKAVFDAIRALVTPPEAPRKPIGFRARSDDD